MRCYSVRKRRRTALGHHEPTKQNRQRLHLRTQPSRNREQRPSFSHQTVCYRVKVSFQMDGVRHIYSPAPSASRRIDIDMLRAVAVLAVIFFHFEVPGFSGGFLGVDIFFVISGYLITLHISESLSTGEFRFSTFYLRRVRRLFPAIFVTLILTSIAALFILPKSLLHDFALSQLAASTYISNIWFWSIADYFDTESIVKPLLHT